MTTKNARKFRFSSKKKYKIHQKFTIKTKKKTHHQSQTQTKMHVTYVKTKYTAAPMNSNQKTPTS